MTYDINEAFEILNNENIDDDENNFSNYFIDSKNQILCTKRNHSALLRLRSHRPGASRHFENCPKSRRGRHGAPPRTGLFEQPLG